MRILLTGSEGYIGAVLGPYLIDLGHEVVGLDSGFHRVGWLHNAVARAPSWVNRDVRRITPDDLAGYDAVVHLAELSNDPLGQIDPAMTYRINHEGSVRLAGLARDAGVGRFVYMSSCSVYGAAGEGFSTEESPTDPLTTYAKCKVLVERDVSKLATDDFSPTFLRNATAYGASPRMRFDLVVNDLAGHAWTEGVIRMTSDGRPWRPFVHILDISQAIGCVLDAPRETVHNEIFNVGDNAQNHQVRQVAEIIAEVFPGCSTVFGDSGGDQRNYRAAFDKIHRTLPAFRTRWDVQAGAQQLLEIFRAIDMTPEVFAFRGYTRLKQITYLLRTGQLDDEFFWSQPTAGRDRAPVEG
jgi:nucleoside-diphosphate-sugar epimerase